MARSYLLRLAKTDRMGANEILSYLFTKAFDLNNNSIRNKHLLLQGDPVSQDLFPDADNACIGLSLRVHAKEGQKAGQSLKDILLAEVGDLV